MTENKKKLFEAVSEQEELKEKLCKAQTKEEIIELAKDLGITLTEDDFAKEDGTLLSEDELAVTAGGGVMDYSCIGIGAVQDAHCMCFLFGAAVDAFCLGYGSEFF